MVRVHFWVCQLGNTWMYTSSTYTWLIDRSMQFLMFGLIYSILLLLLLLLLLFYGFYILNLSGSDST